MSTTVEQHATTAQVNYINSLMSEVELTNVQRAEAEDMAGAGLTKHQASKWIQRLIEIRTQQTLSKRQLEAGTIRDNLQPKSGDFADIPEGRYAVTGKDGTTDFYKVDRPTKGRWAGYTFIKLGLGGPHDDPEWKRIPVKVQKAISKKILADGPKEAMIRFGKELGHCGHCGRTLTNPESIERGIGPVCYGKMGW